MNRAVWCSALMAGALILGTAPALHAQINIPRIGVPGSGPGAPQVQARTLEVRDITLGTPETGTVTIGRITFKGFARGTDSVKAEEVEFESINGALGVRKLEIPALKITDFEAPIDLFRALSEGGGAGLDWPALLQKTTAGELSIINAIDTYTAGSATFQLTYSGFVLKNFRNGIVESARLERTVGASSESNPSERLNFTIGEIGYQGIDVAEFIRFSTGGGSGTAKPLLERAVINDIGVVVKDATIEVKKIEMVGVDGRAPESSLNRPAAAAPRIVLPGQSPPTDFDRRSASFARDVLRHFRISSYSFEGISIAAAKEGAVTIGGISLSGLSGRYLDGFEIKNVAFSSPKVSAKLERFALERFSYGALLDMVLEAAAAGRVPDFSPEKLSELAPKLGAIRLGRLEMETPTGPMSLGGLRMEVDDPDAVVPERFSMALERLKVDLNKMPGPGPARLKAFGYDELTGDAQIQVRAAPAERALMLENSGVLIDRVGRLDIGFRFGNIDVKELTGSPLLVERQLQGMQFERVMVRLTNLGLGERFFGQVARALKPAPESARVRIAAEIKAQALRQFGPLLAPGSAEAIEAFVLSPGRIVATATPRPGMPAPTVGEMERLGAGLMERIIVKIEIPKD